MLRRTGTSGEGMQQNRSYDRADDSKAGVCATLLRAALGTALAVGLGASAARAQTYGSSKGNVFDGLLQTIGVAKSPDANSDINYTERSPLVVPPSRDLPPPASDAAVPVPDWPTDSAKRSGNSKGKPPVAVVPDTAVQTPNPPVEKKPWYNPAGWFNKEEYANFTGEPVRKYLTDPPAGYRIPSPEQPYGIGPDKKPPKKQASSTDFGLGSITPPSGGQPGQ